MKLTLHFDILENDQFLISVNGQKKIANNLDPSVSFHLAEEKTCIVKIEQKIPNFKFTFETVILFLLTSIIQGIFNILMSNTSTDWYKDVRAYYIVATLNINIQSNMTLNICYKNSQYRSKYNLWEFPSFAISPNVVSNVYFAPNERNFCTRYLAFAKKLLSVSIVALCVFCVLLYVAVENDIVIGIAILSIVIIGIILLNMFVLLSEYKKLKKLKQSFHEQLTTK